VSLIHEFTVGILEFASQEHHGLHGVMIIFLQMVKMLQLLQHNDQLLFIFSRFIQGGICDFHPCVDKLIRLGMLCANQFILCGDEDGAVQSKLPLLGGSLHDGFPLSVVGDGLYIDDLIHRFGDLLLSSSKRVSQGPDGVYLFKTGFLNLFCVS
jgi:hypothetical protein